MAAASFRQGQPAAWAFHHQSSQGPGPGQGVEPDRTRPAPGWPRRLGGTDAIPLPSTSLPRSPLGELLTRRASCRRFAELPPSLDDLAVLLEGAYGPGAGLPAAQQAPAAHPANAFEAARDLRGPGRPVPSGGGAYPLELSVLVHGLRGLDPGVYHYRPAGRSLHAVRGPVPRALVRRLFLGQPWLDECGAVLVISARLPIRTDRYGERSYRYALLEAGHVGQCLALLATALGLGSLHLGGFEDRELGRILDLDPEREVPLYGFALGGPPSPRVSSPPKPTGPDSERVAGSGPPGIGDAPRHPEMEP